MKNFFCRIFAVCSLVGLLLGGCGFVWADVLPVRNKNRGGVRVFPPNTPVRNLRGGVKVIGKNSEIVVAGRRPVILGGGGASTPLVPANLAADSRKFASSKFLAEKKFVLIPINGYGKESRFQLREPNTGRVVVSGVGVLAPGAAAPDWYMEFDVSDRKGVSLEFVYEKMSAKPVVLKFADIIAQRKYRGDFSRPSFHFSPRAGSLCDISALTFYGGYWHAFYLFDGFSLSGKNAPFTGRAFSENLMSWLYLSPMRTKFDSTAKMDLFSATSFVDASNRSGLFDGTQGGVVFIRNVEGVGDCVSFTRDMSNFNAAAYNPIISKRGLNPYLFFDTDSKKWVLVRTEFAEPLTADGADFAKAVKTSVAAGSSVAELSLVDAVSKSAEAVSTQSKRFETFAGGDIWKPSKSVAAFDGIADVVKNSTDIVAATIPHEVPKVRPSTVVAIYSGESLRGLKRMCEIPADFDSAQLFKMPVCGAPNPDRWVLFSGDGRYFTGLFDGGVFLPDTKNPLALFHGDVSGLRLWSNAPFGRKIVAGKIIQPAHSPKKFEEFVKFSGSFTAPYELLLVQVYGGQFQLRARTVAEFDYSMLFPVDAIGRSGQLSFKNNSFQLPEAFGNRRVFTGEFHIQNCNRLDFSVWNNSFGYICDSGIFSYSRRGLEEYSFRPQAYCDDSYFGFKMLMDTCGLEFITATGRDVMVAGDNLFDTDYEIRLSSAGSIFVVNLLYYKVAFAPVVCVPQSFLNFNSIFDLDL